MRMSDFPLPPDLPPPTDDGAAAHLEGMALPDVRMPSTGGGEVSLANRTGWMVVYCYPATGTPGVPLPGGWNEIPGARGCTPQTCAFRDRHAPLRVLGVELYGVSVQSSAAQREAAERLGVDFPLLSDASFAFTQALRLPTFEADGRRFLKRVTLVARDGIIEAVFYPVFPPDENAAEVLAWLRDGPLKTPV
jgi:peroxiredoxin